MAAQIRLFDQTPAAAVEMPMPLGDALKWNSWYEDHVATRVEVFFAQSAYARCVEHAESDLNHEVGGALIGEVRYDPTAARTYIVIQDILPARYTAAGRAHVTFTQNTLVYLNNELESRFPGKRMVGWYHTHPRFGVFLSGYDAWLHRHFFDDPIQVALVIDPVNVQGGFFCWQTTGELDPKHCTGFYELSDMDGDSIVRWTNLAPALEAARVLEEDGPREKGEGQ